ncbi:helix-turn-helix domain-containing protein [Rugosimonospora africana]|uniref:HTH cro/C1-type domain-containing protein n=1 Tax=Rugosimonospora africana TaxID=556532 RepID=A0A8J3R190_9ACTN|nr:helix-turn-helix transcriptional regulator [Rugosimonospora africana]GIH20341.1 hypothetical protein Raf01_85130 [Rugosimonospora africana]
MERSQTPSGENSGHRRRLRSALRQLRADARMTQERVAAEMDWSLSKVIRIETGAVTVSVNDVRGLLRLYGVDSGERGSELVELARLARLKPWWYAYREHFAAGFQSYLDLEAGASALKLHQVGCVPGLLQTERYARAVNRATAPEPVPDDRLDLEIDVRMRRQRGVFGQDRPPAIVALLDEGCLWRTCGDRAALRGQLGYLEQIATRPNVTLHVVPFSAPVSAAVFGTFTLLEFRFPNGGSGRGNGSGNGSANRDGSGNGSANHDDSGNGNGKHDGYPGIPDGNGGGGADRESESEGPALYVEGFSSVQSMRSQHPVIAAYARLFDRVRSAALGERESLALIGRVARQL